MPSVKVCVPVAQVSYFKNLCKSFSSELEERTGIRLRGSKLLNSLARPLGYTDYSDITIQASRYHTFFDPRVLMHHIPDQIASELNLETTSVAECLFHAIKSTVMPTDKAKENAILNRIYDSLDLSGFPAVEHGQLILVSGEVNSGKSVILSALNSSIPNSKTYVELSSHQSVLEVFQRILAGERVIVSLHADSTVNALQSFINMLSLSLKESSIIDLAGRLRQAADVYSIHCSRSTKTNSLEFHGDFFERELSVSASASRTDMNPYRKLLTIGLNKLLAQGLLSLEWNEEANDEEGYFETEIMGENAVVLWRGISHGEVTLAVWWKYDHDKHPQANLTGDAKESFHGPAPLAKRSQYRQFVGVVASVWLERKTGAFLQGMGSQHIFEKYARRGELELIKKWDNPVPDGFAVEGKFFP